MTLRRTPYFQTITITVKLVRYDDLDPELHDIMVDDEPAQLPPGAEDVLFKIAERAAVGHVWEMGW